MKSVNNPDYEIVYNGEVYNFVELREELLKENPKLKFKTNSDTEVVLEAFIQWGDKAFDKFNGMFGLAILDHAKGEVTLARDHFGMKPVYYYGKDGGVIFASEINTMRFSLEGRVPFIDKELLKYLFSLNDS